MKAAVRYYSKLSNTRALTEGAGVKAFSVTDTPESTERVDVLFLGGAPYAKELRAYAEKLTPDQVGHVVLFTTSNWSRRTIYALRKLLKERDISVDDRYFHAHMTRIKARPDAARTFAAGFVSS